MSVPSLFLDLTQSTSLVTELTGGLTPTDLTARVEASSAKDPEGVVVYRPYYVAARLLSDRPTQIESASGVQFRATKTIMRELYETQAAFDTRYDLDVPQGVQVRSESNRPLSSTVVLRGSW